MCSFENFLAIFREHPIPSLGLPLNSKRKSFCFISFLFIFVCFFDIPTFPPIGILHSIYILRMNLKQALSGAISRTLRFIGIIAVIYVSMVFYLALTERRNAYPRAISHNEARAAIQETARTAECTLEDGATLNGWIVGNNDAPALLYYPGADEDAAQFLAEIGTTDELRLITFNYRGSADNKGTPSQETFEPDAKAIAECASQLAGGRVQFLAGRGTGAILAAEQLGSGQALILIDPVESIADALSRKYRFLYPKFLVRSTVKMPINKLSEMSKQVSILFDRKNERDGAHTVFLKIPNSKAVERHGDSLKDILSKSIQKN